MRSVDEIVALYKQRMKYYGPLHGKMRQIQSIYNGTAEVPLPDIEQSDLPSVPNLLAQGVDQMAGRISSVVPTVNFTAKSTANRGEVRRATTAGRVVTGWWQQDRLQMKMKQRARHMIAYGMSPVVIRWDWKRDSPTWHVRHPLETFASPDIIPGTTSPTDCIFAYRRTVGWLRSNGYGFAVNRVTGDYDVHHDSSMLLLEYVDAEGTQLILTSYDSSSDDMTGYQYVNTSNNGMRGVELERVPNPEMRNMVSVPMRITLDGPAGQFDNMIGMYYQQAKLMALEIIAVEKGIFPDTYLISRPGEVGRFLDGPHDGRSGMVNIVAGGDIREIQSQPGYLTNPTIDRLERNQRVTAGIPAEFGGESSTNIRTGRRGDAVLSAVIDFPVAEAQETFAFALQEEDEAGISLAKAYGGDETRTIYVGTGNSAKAVTYVANKVFETPTHVVSYPATGTDLNSLIIGLGQRVGLGIMSKETAAGLDPFVDNPEVEHDRIIAEGIEQALVAGIQQQAAAGSLPPLVLAKVMRLVQDDRMELAEALEKVTQEAIEEQQAEQEQQQQPMMPGGEEQMMTPDQAMSGAAVRAMAGPEGMARTQGPNQSQQNLMSLLSTLRRPQTASGGV
jgi:hypothetical protein